MPDVTAGLGRLRTVVLDCPDPSALATFWSVLLGRQVASVEEDWVELEPVVGDAAVAFQRVERHQRPRWPSGRWPQQLHLDVFVEDLTIAVEAAVRLGARVLSEVQGGQGSPWQVLEDPAGHPFCFVTG